jgi:chorismate synthase
MDLTLVTSGESHGPGITAVIVGLPSGLEIDRESLRRDLARRQAGYGRSPRQQIEKDDAEILGGLRHGKTLGGPVALIIRNRDHANWGAAMSAWPVTEDELAEVAARRSRAVVLPRPGHADLAGALKYRHDDIRNVLERASARETSARVAAGAFAKALLAPCDIRVRGRVIQIGDVGAPEDDADEAAFDRAVESEVGCSDPETSRRMIEAIDAARVDRDTLGGLLEVRVFGAPPGLGSYTEPRLRLDARLAAAALGIQAMKGVEIGSGFANASRRGSEVHDELFHDDTRGYHRTTNRAGGIEGGMTNGETVVVRIAMKPIPTLMKPLRSARLDTHEPADALVERSDTTAIAAAAVVAEAVVAFELARCLRETFGGDHIDDMLAAYRAYVARLPWHPSL